MKICIFMLAALISLGQCDNPRSRADSAAAALMKYYNETDGCFNTTGWWNSANALTSIIDYMILTGSKQYLSQVSNTFEKAKSHPETKDFTNEFTDDSGWWGLAWVRAYDLTKDKKYLEMAQKVCDYMAQYKDGVCKGGIYWKTDKANKNAISNELFITLSSAIHNRMKGDTKYLNQAKEVWNWFKASGMINKDNLINDGLGKIDSCKPEGQTFSYNQGVILHGLVELNKATKNKTYLNEAVAIANAATTSKFLNPNGVFLEPTGTGCQTDWASFKGIFVRNLGKLDRFILKHPYRAYLEKNAATAYKQDRNNDNQYDIRWEGPVKETGAACQHSAVDLMNAALKSNQKKVLTSFRNLNWGSFWSNLLPLKSG